MNLDYQTRRDNPAPAAPGEPQLRSDEGDRVAPTAS